MQRICDFIAKWMGVIMFGMGLTLSANDLKIVLSRPKDILIGCLTQLHIYRDGKKVLVLAGKTGRQIAIS